MKKVKIMLAVAFGMTALVSTAQEIKKESKKEVNLKLYSTLEQDWFLGTKVYPTFAVSWASSGKNFQEIELSRFNFNRKTFGDDIRTAEVATRYEYNFNLRKKQDAKVRLFAGAGVKALFENYKETPYSTNLFPYKYRILKGDFYVTPRIQFVLSERMALDVNVPVVIATGTTMRSYHDNPTLPIEDRKSSYNYAYFFPEEVWLRLGITRRL